MFFESEFGNGSKFIIKLPIITASETLSKKDSGNNISISNKGMNILLIDDEVELLKIISKFLSLKGYNVFTAKDGEDGIAIIKKNKIDAIVIDYSMPKMNAEQFYNETQNIGVKIPMIICSGHIDIEDKPFVKCQGIIGILIKPIDINRLLEVLDNVD